MNNILTSFQLVQEDHYYHFIKELLDRSNSEAILKVSVPVLNAGSLEQSISLDHSNPTCKDKGRHPEKTPFSCFKGCKIRKILLHIHTLPYHSSQAYCNGQKIHFLS